MAVLNARVSASTLHKIPKVTQDTQACSSGSLQPRSLTPFLLMVPGIKCRTALLLLMNLSNWILLHCTVILHSWLVWLHHPLRYQILADHPHKNPHKYFFPFPFAVLFSASVLQAPEETPPKTWAHILWWIGSFEKSPSFYQQISRNFNVFLTRIWKHIFSLSDVIVSFANLSSTPISEFAKSGPGANSLFKHSLLIFHTAIKYHSYLVRLTCVVNANKEDTRPDHHWVNLLMLLHIL